MTTTLNFQKNGNVYVAETTVTGDYNLHVERKGGGSFNIYQRGTQNGLYKVCSGMPGWMNYDAGKVIDWAFSHGVYPEGGLAIRIESGSEVTSGTLSYGAEG